ncbi:MAG: phage tail protein, partial [Solirubrobacteraceae bacterium]
MRGLMPGLAVAHPLGLALPGLYQDDSLTQRLTTALDEVLAPVVSTLDALGVYLDPALAPVDFVAWLASWVGVVATDAGSPERQRALVAQAVELHRWRGTVRGLAHLVQLYTGVEPEIVESGGVHWSLVPEAPPPGSDEPMLVVRLRVADPGTIDVRRLDALVATAKPAHIPHR